MERQDWTLMAIAIAEAGGLSPVQIQKSLFLLGEQLPGDVSEGFYGFVAYDYGPFSKQIYADASGLAERGLVAIDHTGGYREYRITPEGAKRAEEQKAEAPSRAVSYLENVIPWAQRKTFS